MAILVSSAKGQIYLALIFMLTSLSVGLDLS